MTLELVDSVYKREPLSRQEMSGLGHEQTKIGCWCHVGFRGQSSRNPSKSRHGSWDVCFPPLTPRRRGRPGTAAHSHFRTYGPWIIAHGFAWRLPL